MLTCAAELVDKTDESTKGRAARLNTGLAWTKIFNKVNSFFYIMLHVSTRQTVQVTMSNCPVSSMHSHQANVLDLDFIVVAVILNVGSCS